MFMAFLRSTAASVAVQFGLYITPVIGLAGAALDYSLAARDRGNISNALDAGVIAGARIVGYKTPPDVRAEVERMVRANLREDLRTIPITINITENQSVQASSSYTRNTTLLRVVGINTIDVGSTATAMAPTRRKIEVALALDNTGSMGTMGKIEALRAAVLSFITSMENASRDPGDVRIAIVPFDRMVRVGTSYAAANWIKNIPSNWDGCIIDRDEAENVRDTPPTSNLTRFPAARCSSGSLTLLRPLSNDWAALRATANAMTPSGNTNVTIGVSWAWHLISSNTPFTEGSGNQANVDRWVIVLTDGDNTQDRWTTNSAQIDTRTRAACSNVKADGIRVMTVRVINGNRNLLRDCASDPAYYYEVTDASQLTAVFQRMAANISSLQLTR